MGEGLLTSSTYSHQVNTDIYNVHSVYNIVLLAALDQFLYILFKWPLNLCQAVAYYNRSNQGNWLGENLGC